MFIDASALTAILLTEPEAIEFAKKIAMTKDRFTSAIAIYETTLAVTRVTGRDIHVVRIQLDALLAQADVRVVSINSAEANVALDAHARFGKGRHPARLNMGDCFAYACAVTQNAPLLYKGEDFALTDVASV